MTDYYRQVENNHIIGIGTNGPDTADAISEAEYFGLLSMIRGRPAAPEGYVYLLRADTLMWELAELPEPEPEEEAAAADYEAALGRLGVEV